MLLCQRAIEPRNGYWTLPAGFLEIGETLTAGARPSSLKRIHFPPYGLRSAAQHRPRGADAR